MLVWKMMKVVQMMMMIQPCASKTGEIWSKVETEEWLNLKLSSDVISEKISNSRQNMDNKVFIKENVLHKPRLANPGCVRYGL